MSEAPCLVDDEARQAIVARLSETLFVEAGAGSGKTWALVERVASLITKADVPVSEIAAITFSEAAAAELRVRVRTRLAEILAAPESEDGDRKKAAEALARIDEAPISTIHGFCHRLCSAYPVEAGLPLRIEVLDEIAESVEWQRRWSLELDRLGNEPGMPELLAAGWALGVADRYIEQLAEAVEERWHLGRREPPDLERGLEELGLVVSEAVESICGAIRRARKLRHHCSDPTDFLLLRLDELCELDASLSSTAATTERLALLAAAPDSGRGGAKTGWTAEIETVRTELDEARRVREETLATATDVVLSTLAQYFEARAHVEAADRRRRGRLGFHDLLVCARDLLRDSRGVLESVRRRFRCLLIDEFQDTDPLQLEIATLIGTDGGVPIPGRLFFVGDPKQSIYRFRGADIGVYHAARSELIGDRRLVLSSNFRSQPAVIDFVNACFHEPFGENYEGLAATRAPLGGSPAHAVHVVGGELPNGTRRPAQRVLEAADCTAAIETILAEAWPVVDPETKVARPVRRSDIAILLPRRNGLSELEAALDERGVAYQVESASLVFKSQEVRDLLVLGRALSEPGDEAALVGTLRSPLYSIGDDELVAWRAAHGRWSVEDPIAEGAREAAPAVAAALLDLRELRSSLVHLSAADALAEAVVHRRLLVLLALRPHAREAWRRIRYLLERARLFEEAGGGGLGDFADWVEMQLDGRLSAHESILPDLDDDVVRVMTVHGAKGLEFPVVVMCGFGTNDAESPSRPVVLRRPDGSGVEVRFKKGLETRRYPELYAADQALERAEITRLLYVAATRARDHLVICAHRAPGKPVVGEDLYSHLASAAGDGVASLVTSSASGVPGPEPNGPASFPLLERFSTRSSLDQFSRSRELLVEASCRPVSVRATEVAGRAEAPSEEEGVAADVVSRPGRGRAGTQLGRAVHATLQLVAMSDAISLGRPGEDGAAFTRLRAIATLEANAEQIPERAGEVARLARAALKSPVVASAFSSGSARRELYVAAPISGRILDGFVDLCCVDEDGSLVVVDYKTDVVSDPEVLRERAEHYELQAAAYALALEEATGRSVSRCVLVFLQAPAEPFERELRGSELVAKVTSVRRLVTESA